MSETHRPSGKRSSRKISFEILFDIVKESVNVHDWFHSRNVIGQVIDQTLEVIPVFAVFLFFGDIKQAVEYVQVIDVIHFLEKNTKVLKQCKQFAIR